MIEFNQLKHLIAIAKNKTISKTAEELLFLSLALQNPCNV